MPSCNSSKSEEEEDPKDRERDEIFSIGISFFDRYVPPPTPLARGAKWFVYLYRCKYCI